MVYSEKTSIQHCDTMVENMSAPPQQEEFNFEATAKRFGLNLNNIGDDNEEPNLKGLVYGAPGSGKTAWAMINLLNYYGSKGEFVFMSYDGQTKFTKKQLTTDGVITPEQGKQIKVFNLYLASPEGEAADGILEGGQLIIEQTRRIIKQFHPTAFVFDYVDSYAQQAEMLARMRKDIRPFQGVPKKDWELWRERKSFLVTIDKLASQNLKPGGMTIYTGWETVKEITDLGQTNNLVKEPNWTGIISAGYTFRVRCIREPLTVGGVYLNRFWNRVMDSRLNTLLKDGSNIEVTGYKPILPKYVEPTTNNTPTIIPKIEETIKTEEIPTPNKQTSEENRTDNPFGV